MISTRDLSLLPGVDRLRRIWQSMAMLDAVLCPEWEFRYYSFNAGWGDGEQMGSIRNGSGDDVFAHFGPAGCWIKGFAHECPMSSFGRKPPRPWAGVLDAVPSAFAGCLGEPAFGLDAISFCVWRQYTDSCWQVGPVAFVAGQADPDGSEGLLYALDGEPETYRAWASEYYERDVELGAVEQVYRQDLLTSELVARLNPEVRLSELAADIREIGYPESGA
jgi:hypothetical protein